MVLIFKYYLSQLCIIGVNKIEWVLKKATVFGRLDC